MSEYQFNPMLYKDKLHEFDKTTYLYWFYQILVGNIGGGDFFGKLSIIKNNVPKLSEPLLRFGVLDYLMILPFIGKLGVFSVFKMFDKLTSKSIILNFLIGMVLGLLVFIYFLDILTLPFKLILAGAISTLALPFLFLHHHHIQKQKRAFQTMPVLYIGDHSPLINDILPPQLLTRLMKECKEVPLETLLGESADSDKQISLKQFIFKKGTPDSTDEISFGLYLDWQLIALIMPSRLTKNGILALENLGIFKVALSTPISFNHVKPLLERPHFAEARTAAALFTLTAAIKDASAGEVTGMGNVPDQLFTEISKFADLRLASEKMKRDNASIFYNCKDTFFPNSSDVNTKPIISTFTASPT